MKSNDENPKFHHEQLIERAAKLIQTLYVETAPIKGKVKELDLEDVHIALQERAECYLKREVSHVVKITFIAPQLKLSVV